MLTAAMKRLNLETDRNFFKTIFAIALPSAFQGLVSLLVVYLDDIMVSRISSMEGLGVPGIAQAADPRGEIRFRSARRECTFDLSPEREYRLTTVRSRGFSRRVRADY